MYKNAALSLAAKLMKQLTRTQFHLAIFVHSSDAPIILPLQGWQSVTHCQFLVQDQFIWMVSNCITRPCRIRTPVVIKTFQGEQYLSLDYCVQRSPINLTTIFTLFDSTFSSCIHLTHQSTSVLSSLAHMLAQASSMFLLISTVFASSVIAAPTFAHPDFSDGPGAIIDYLRGYGGNGNPGSYQPGSSFFG
ncbi:unnamed protein product [Somion occarium]|uniref:Uncharacterized protein n=1 Tax=Somion occarium TaxID=3059160 RepID=A0ABP1CPQ6_9APHY